MASDISEEDGQEIVIDASTKETCEMREDHPGESEPTPQEAPISHDGVTAIE